MRNMEDSTYWYLTESVIHIITFEETKPMITLMFCIFYEDNCLRITRTLKPDEPSEEMLRQLLQ
jgi:hypothetical protein